MFPTLYGPPPQSAEGKTQTETSLQGKILVRWESWRIVTDKKPKPSAKLHLYVPAELKYLNFSTILYHRL